MSNQRGQAYGRQNEELLGSGNYPSSQLSGTGLPGALQAGRPGLPSANTAPTTIPQLPPLSISSHQPPSSRGSSVSQTHSYSRSSPAAALIDDPAKYSTPPSHKFASLQTPQTGTYSPLGLADIRPPPDSADIPPSANPFQDYPSEPTLSSYVAPWAVYAFDWCKWPLQQHQIGESAGKVAVGSYLEDGHNYIQILDTSLANDTDTDSDTGSPQVGIEFTKTAEAAHSYPVTRILWEPESAQKTSCDLLATSGDHLRLWSLPSSSASNPGNSITRPSNQGADRTVQKLTPLALLSNSKSPEHTAPLTSLDWNTLSPSLIITSSIDTTCTIWDIPSLTAKTQLIAHDKEVFDVRFCANSVDVFVSCGADGSVRMFDLRSLEHSTIIYEPNEKTDPSSSPGDMSPTKAQQTMSHAPPLLRLAASPYDAHHLATFSQESNSIRILDVRQPGQALLELSGHRAPVNCIEWSPHRRGTLASGADDSLVLIWDLMSQGANGSQQAPYGPSQGHGQGQGSDMLRSPAASWQCDFEVNNLSWAPPGGLSNGSEWLGVSGGRGIWAVAL